MKKEARKLTSLTFHKGQNIFTIGQIVQFCYLVKSGEVISYRWINGVKEEIERLGPGKIIGASHIKGKPHPYTVSATEPCELILMYEKDLINYNKNHVEFKKTVFTKGECVFEEGQKGECAYLIKSGKVTIYRIINDKKMVLAQREAGEILGEMAVITGETRSATVEAATNCEMIIVDDKILQAALAKSLPIVNAMTKQLIHRVRENDKKVLEQVTPNMFKSICYLIRLISSQQFEFEYNTIITEARDILNIPKSKLDNILKYLHDKQIINSYDKDGTLMINDVDPEQLIQIAAKKWNK